MLSSLRSVMGEIDSWHAPSNMGLGTCYDHNESHRRSIYHLHLLHLAGQMSCYHYITVQDPEHKKMLQEYGDMAVTTAVLSVRRMRLIFHEEGVLAHHWLIIIYRKLLSHSAWLALNISLRIHADNSCVILLHHIVEKKMYESQQWLKCVECCLHVLKVYGRL